MGIIRRIYHKLFKCPTFWRITPAFRCPRCGARYRCYWDGNDIDGHGIDYCNKCMESIKRHGKRRQGWEY